MGSKSNDLLDARWATATVGEQLEALKRGEITSLGLVELYLYRISKLNDSLGAIVTLDASAALEAAREADAERAASGQTRPLLGIPFTVKDAISTANLRTTAGTTELSDYVPDRDAEVVSALRAAGAVLMGKSNLPAWSGNVQTFNEVFGLTRNPWDLDRTPGGSSGGAAAAIASGMTSFEIGSDLGGSIRTPSHFCGTVGHRPSRGLVPQLGYIDHVGGGITETDLNVLGPMARSVSDVRLLLNVTARPAQADAPAWHLELPQPRRKNPHEWRVAYWFGDGTAEFISEELEKPLRTAMARLAGLGVQTEEVRPDVDTDLSRQLAAKLIAAATTLARDPRQITAEANDHASWLRNHEKLSGLQAQWRNWFQDYDALVCPVLAVPAFPHDQTGSIADLSIQIGDRLLPHRDLTNMWNSLSSVAGLPATAVPVGFTDTGLPAGVQVIAPYLGDLSSLAVAELIEQTGGGYTPPPISATI